MLPMTVGSRDKLGRSQPPNTGSQHGEEKEAASETTFATWTYPTWAYPTLSAGIPILEEL